MDVPPSLNLPPELANNPDYEIVRELGRGGMGIVYLAKHRLSGRVEVLKVMNKDQLGRPASRERFLREIRSAARLDHKNVVKMHTALERGELMVLVMEYVPGEDLAQVVESRGPLSVLHACYYAQQVASGLQHACEKDMVHRDIKPQNLMLLREGKRHTIKILDFGLAKVVREQAENTGLTGEGKMMGTPDYMAPEQTTDAASADIRADIYSLGCTLYFLLTGIPPFAGKSLYAVMFAHQSLEARLLHVVRPEVPESLSAVVAKMMAKAPAHRYQTPMEVMRALDPFVKGTLNPLPPQTAAPPDGQGVAASWSLLSQETMLVDRASSVRTMKPTGAMRSRKWLAVSLAGVLLAGLLGLSIGLALRKPLPSVDVTVKKPLPSVDVAPPTITNAIGMKLTLVKPGVFLMGSAANEAERSDDEQQHEVEISRPFYVGIYEVTQEQYERVMGMNPSWFSSTGGGQDKVAGMDTRQFPVEDVSWENAIEFCRRLSGLPEEKGKEHLYRLPTEAEWEYSCRGGPFFKKPPPPFYFGNSLSAAQANFDGNYPYGSAAKGVWLERTTKVGSYPANPLGLYDLHGNVFEWCADWYDAEYYKRSIRQNPQGPENGTRRVLRGGSWVNYGRHCRAAYRYSNAPGVRYYGSGFRVVLLSGART